MSDNTAKILAKGCKSTGVTEDLARRLFDNPGMKLMAIVELQPSARHIKKDDKQVVDLEILAIEPVIGDGPTADTVDEHVRTIQAALYRNRKLNEAGGEELPYDDGPEPTVSEVLAQGQGLFDVDDLDDEDDEQDEDDEGNEGNEDDPYGYVHARGGATPPGVDTPCGLTATFGKNLRTHANDDQVTCPDCLTTLHADQDDTDDEPVIA